MTDHGFALAPGDRIREFRIDRELGAGGFGVTYLAWDEELERWVALKEYLPKEWGTRLSDGSVGPSFSTEAHYFEWGLAKFLEEARTLARLNHPQIVRVYQVIEERGTAYMAMEYVEGRSLKSELESVGRLSEGRVREILDALMSGLETVHACGILHRDIKPANIILRAADGWPVLIDFGAARQNMSRESRSLLSAMTPPYAPVEQYETDGDQGPWTDIYAVGVLAYECLTGERPAESVSRFRNDTTRPLAEAAPTASPQLTALVEMALEVDERDRPQDVASWRRMLDDAPPSPPAQPSWSEPAGVGAPQGDSPLSVAGEESGSAADSSASVAGRASHPAGDSSGRSLASEELHPGSDSEDGQLSGDSSESAPGLSGGRGNRKLWPAGIGLRRRLVVGGLAAAAAGGLWWGISGLSSFESIPEEKDRALSEMASPPPSWEMSPQPEPSPPNLSPVGSGGIETRNGDRLIAPSPQPAMSPPDPSPSDGAGAPQEDASPPRPTEDSPLDQVDMPLQDDLGPQEDEVLSRDEEVLTPEAEVAPPEQAEDSSPAEEVGPPPETGPTTEEENDLGALLPAPGTTFQDCPPGEACGLPLMVVIPPSGSAGTVTTDPLAVGVHEVTVGQWGACVQDANSCDPRVLDREGNVHPDGGGFPVVAVTWDDAQAYVAWLRRRTDQPYRLLSEAEWEYMARAGTQTGRYWNSDSQLCRFANAWDITAHNSISNSTRAFADCEDNFPNTAPVGSFAANGFGVHDALGNVEEWVENGVVRGGSWRDGPEQLRAERRSELRISRSAYVGFRVARTLD